VFYGKNNSIWAWNDREKYVLLSAWSSCLIEMRISFAQVLDACGMGWKLQINQEYNMNNK